MPNRLYPCSLCLRLRPRVKFAKHQLRTRVEPICDDCFEHPQLAQGLAALKDGIDG